MLLSSTLLLPSLGICGKWLVQSTPQKSVALVRRPEAQPLAQNYAEHKLSRMATLHLCRCSKQTAVLDPLIAAHWAAFGHGNSKYAAVQPAQSQTGAIMHMRRCNAYACKLEAADAPQPAVTVTA
jgi:hypothetical protein